ncbi:hypothetical protein [Caldisalinibacter kiritimatiensis]|uniref:Uncharacterized protein n=1 Tax=Caldisalinibacter kiritimatiensis TaxID=1304284 RepID=R1CBG8_9FIRM|nr:hypothetical protein [Caldisalinibacter kiritimatiensis]EOC99664.1 hypothetical protein L21TH_2307 [Caldisalinibacter kiritimatiensis]
MNKVSMIRYDIDREEMHFTNKEDVNKIRKNKNKLGKIMKRFADSIVTYKTNKRNKKYKFDNFLIIS